MLCVFYLTVGFNGFLWGDGSKSLFEHARLFGVSGKEFPV